jgi:hypothetical protein
MLEDQIGRAKGLLDQATKATGIVNARAMVKAGPGMEDINAQGQDWGAALVLVRQAAVELAASTKLAKDMAGAAKAKKNGDEAMVPAAVDIALKDLRKEVNAAKTVEHADIVPDLFHTMETALTEGQKLFEKNDLLGAGAQLKIVGDALVKAKIAQAEHGRFVTAYDALKLRETALTTSTVPPAAKIKDKTDPLVAALKTAKEQDDAHDWNKAFAALRIAEVAADAAKAASDGRAAYDTTSKDITDGTTTLTDPVKGQILDMVAKAETAADAFNFAHAMRFLENAQARVDGENVKGLATASPLDIGKIEAAVDKMLKAVGGDELLARPTDSKVQARNPQQAGKRIPAHEQKTPNGPELLDQIVKNFGDDVPVEVIIAITKKRFGIDLEISALKWNGDKLEDKVQGVTVAETDVHKGQSQRSKSARNLYSTLAMTPEQSDRNPSLKTVERKMAFEVTNTTPGSATKKRVGGGWYESDTNKTVMKGRPGLGSSQQFGAAQTSSDDGTPMLPPKPPKPWDEKTTKEQKELEVYESANDTPVDFFEFANVHETGHGVDDRLGFMAARMGNKAFGDWQLHGGDYGAIAGPVGAHYAKKFSVSDQAGVLKDYVIHIIAGNNPEIPAVADDKQEGVTKACDKIKNEWYENAKTSAKPWWNQGKCDKITMDDGRIYQESYANRWSSYPASERNKGITGYQFRAPGEWFAELFSAYHHEKLKPGHPARKWLSSLQL